MTNTFHYSCRTFKREDELAIKELISDAFNISGEFWTWKYRLNPHFDPSLVLVAEKDGKVIGCLYYIVRDVKISSSLSIKAVLGADLVVHPDHRRRGIGTALLQFSRTSGILRDKGAVITYGFYPSLELGQRFYKGAINSIAIPDSTTVYTRLLNCKRLKEKTKSINKFMESSEELRGKLENLNMTVLFRLIGAPPFTIKTTDNGVQIEDVESANPDVTVQGDYFLFSSFIEGKRRMHDLVKAILRGKLRIKGSLRNILRLYGLFKIIKLTLSSK